IIAALFVPICMTAGFSTLGTAILIGTAGARGDAGSPASDSTLGPTAGLNADGKHHHIWDTCVPTFIHFNIPLFIFGCVGSLLFYCINFSSLGNSKIKIGGLLCTKRSLLQASPRSCLLFSYFHWTWPMSMHEVTVGDIRKIPIMKFLTSVDISKYWSGMVLI